MEDLVDALPRDTEAFRNADRWLPRGDGSADMLVACHVWPDGWRNYADLNTDRGAQGGAVAVSRLLMSAPIVKERRGPWSGNLAIGTK